MMMMTMTMKTKKMKKMMTVLCLIHSRSHQIHLFHFGILPRADSVVDVDPVVEAFGFEDSLDAVGMDADEISVTLT